MRRSIAALTIAAIGALLVAGAGLTAQATANGVVRGRVSAEGRPLRRVRVTAGANARGLPVTVYTNSRGEFEFKDLPAGSYSFSAAAAGFLTTFYGPAALLDPQIVQVRSGQVLDKIDIALSRGGVLAGTVTDEFGLPFPGVEVNALAFRFQNGMRSLEPTDIATTNDRGEFRLSSLPAGTFYVTGSSTETWLSRQRETFGYALTYYPGVPGDSAQPIRLAPAQTVSNIVFQLLPSRAIRMSGRVQRATGDGVGGAQVVLSRTIRGAGIIFAAGRLAARTASDGAFELKGIPPAEYILSADAPGVSAAKYIVTTGADVENLLLVPESGSALDGSITDDLGRVPAIPRSPIRVSALQVDEDAALGWAPTVTPLTEEWSFNVSRAAGRFLFRVDGLPDDWMLRTVLVNDIDSTDVPFTVPTSTTSKLTVKMVVTQRIGRVTGEVVNSDGQRVKDARVVVFADDRQLWTPGSRYITTALTADDGRFAISKLPAGRYLAIGRDFVARGEWQNPEFLTAAARGAVSFSLTDGGSATVTIRLATSRP